MVVEADQRVIRQSPPLFLPDVQEAAAALAACCADLAEAMRAEYMAPQVPSGHTSE